MVQHADIDHTGLTGVPSAGILAVNRYAPATTVYTINSTTRADVDATNMAVTFTAPASGNVIVVCSAYQDKTVGDGDLIWDLRESTTDLNVGGIINRFATADGGYVTMQMYVSGISGGSHTYKWSFGLTATGGSGGRIVVGPGAGGTGNFPPGIMTVCAAP